MYEIIKKIALSLPETTEGVHHAITSFRVQKKTFATVNVKEHRATVKLSKEDQDIFTKMTKGAIYPVPNQWGKLGWTHIDFAKATEELVSDALHLAWWDVASPKIKKLNVHIMEGLI